MNNIHWELVEGIKTVNIKEIPFLRLTVATLTNKKKLPKTQFKKEKQVPIAVIKNENEEILGVAYYKLGDFALGSPYHSYDGTFSTTGNRPSEAIDTRLVLNQRIPDQELECEDIRKIISTLHLDNN
jgi:hypothetical protein